MNKMTRYSVRMLPAIHKELSPVVNINRACDLRTNYSEPSIETIQKHIQKKQTIEYLNNTNIPNVHKLIIAKYILDAYFDENDIYGLQMAMNLGAGGLFDGWDDDDDKDDV